MSKKIIGTEYEKFLGLVKESVYTSRLKAAISVNKELIILYHYIGRQILESQGKNGWGSKVISQLSSDLRHEFPEIRGFSPQNLIIYAKICPGVYR